MFGKMANYDIFYLVLAACSFTPVTSQCSDINLKETQTKFIDGKYSEVDQYCGDRNTSIHEEDAYYMYYDNYYWYVADDVCGSGSGQYARVRSDENYPENIDEIWQERDETSAWVDNEAVCVECYVDPPTGGVKEDGISTRAIIGIVVFVMAFMT